MATEAKIETMPVPAWKVKLVGLAAGTTALVSMASAATYDLNGTIGPILDSVGELVPSIINLVVSLLPAIIAMAVIGFLIAFFDKILNMINIKS